MTVQNLRFLQNKTNKEILILIFVLDPKIKNDESSDINLINL